MQPTLEAFTGDGIVIAQQITGSGVEGEGFDDLLRRPLGGRVSGEIEVDDLAMRRVCSSGATPTPNGAFMMQIARNFTDDFDGFLEGYRYLIIDRDTKSTETLDDNSTHDTVRRL